MDDDRCESVRPLRLWPWLIVATAVAICAVRDGLLTSGGSYSWGVFMPGGKVLLIFSVAVYVTCFLRSLWIYAKPIRVPGRKPVFLSVAVAAAFASLLVVLALTAVWSVTAQLSSRHYQDHWLLLTVVVAVAALFELAGRSRAFTTPRFRFTLRWLLVATLVVAALAGLLRLMVVRISSRLEALANRALPMELSSLDVALKMHHATYEAWPPSTPDQFDRHVQQVFPKARQWRADLAAAGLDPETMDAEEALVFWLGGMPNPNDPGDPKRPAVALPGEERPFRPDAPRTAGLFLFDPNRLVDADGDGWPEYQARDLRGATRPKVYRLEGKTVVAVEYSGTGATRMPQRIYRLGVDGLDVSAPAQEAPPPE